MRSSIAAVGAAVIPLTFRFGVNLLRMKAKRRRALKVFRRQLRGQGFTKSQIDELAQNYENLGRLRNYLGESLPFFLS